MFCLDHPRWRFLLKARSWSLTRSALSFDFTQCDFGGCEASSKWAGRKQQFKRNLSIPERFSQRFSCLLRLNLGSAWRSSDEEEDQASERHGRSTTLVPAALSQKKCSIHLRKTMVFTQSWVRYERWFLRLATRYFVAFQNRWIGLPPKKRTLDAFLEEFQFQHLQDAVARWQPRWDCQPADCFSGSRLFA